MCQTTGVFSNLEYIIKYIFVHCNVYLKKISIFNGLFKWTIKSFKS